MSITTKANPKKPPRAKLARPKTWQEAIRLHLAKVPEVDAVFANVDGNTIHVFAVVEDFHQTNYKRLLKQEDQIEKAFPEISFEFHTRAHRGRKPQGAGQYDSELVYLR